MGVIGGLPGNLGGGDQVIGLGGKTSNLVFNFLAGEKALGLRGLKRGGIGGGGGGGGRVRHGKACEEVGAEGRRPVNEKGGRGKGWHAGIVETAVARVFEERKRGHKIESLRYHDRKITWDYDDAIAEYI
ncbi:hypothetical protein PR202_ga21318 [Eleusine coracana subsp. coracana]|uniref:Uncharacterized protein n=1 Tax=Eleusine coracana subsp. coracana TaxID=191504 RepID=A0AAV5D133_ELECO|nr:hypothetical protein PR202_ga21318 [Eleusine coracana subsp. coracana]